MRLTDFAATATLALNGLIVSAGNGLGGRVVTSARPGRVEDYTADPRISHEYDAPVCAEGLRAIAAVPVVMAGPARSGSALGGSPPGGPAPDGSVLGGPELGGSTLDGSALGGSALGVSVLAVLYAGTREPIAVGGRAVEAM